MNQPFWTEIIDRYYPEGSPLRDIFIAHSRNVADLALEFNGRFAHPLPAEDVEAAAMLHDIGIFLTHAPSIECHGEAFYLMHGHLGAELLRREGVDEKFARVCERHTGVGLTPEDIAALGVELPADRSYMPETPLEKLICYADKFYSKSGSGRRKTIEAVERSIARFGTDTLARFHSLQAFVEQEMMGTAREP